MSLAGRLQLPPMKPRAAKRACCFALAEAGVYSLVSLWPSLMAAHAAEIVITWTRVQQQIRPEVRVGQSSMIVRLTLKGGSEVEEHRTVTNRRGQKNEKNATGQFRNSMKLGGNLESSWQILDSRTLVRTERHRQHEEIMRVVTTSATTCQAEIVYKLKPGFKEFRLRRMVTREPAYFSSMSAEQISCRVVAQ